MFFRQYPTKDSTLSYFFGCGTLAKSVAVDVVAGDEPWFIEEARKANVKITHVVDTHVHADHVSGGRNLAAMAGALYCLHESDAGLVNFPFEPLRDSQVIEAGNVVVRVLHTPGHTPDSVSLLVTDKRRGDEPWFALTGDTLFVGAIGRPDLAGREREMASLLFDTLQTKLLPLPDTIELFPGHQAGSVVVPASPASHRPRWGSSGDGIRRSPCATGRNSSPTSPSKFRRGRRTWTKSSPRTSPPERHR